MADITNIGGRNTSGGQLTPDAFLETLLEYQSNEIAFEENLNKLKITNVENLGALRKQAEKDLLKVVELANKAQTEKFQRDKEKKERAEHTRRVKELEKLSSKEQQLARAIEAARHKEALKNIKAEQVAEEKYANKKSKRELEEAKKKSREAGKAQAKEDLATVLGKGVTLTERRAALGNMFTTKKMRDIIDPETGKKIGEEVASEQRS